MEKNNLLSADAYFVFETNKFLDFKNKDSLHKINNTVYKKIDLNNYFQYKQNWKDIENETYLYFGSYNVWREIKTVYNKKGVVLNRYEKIYVGDDYNETRIIINQFDDKSRVTKITKRNEHVRPEENKETIIDVQYKHDIHGLYFS